MIDHLQYAVYLHPGALESLGEAVAPYLTQDATGPHFVCLDIDTGGALCELTVERSDPDGTAHRTEIMIPIAMIRLVMSVGVLGGVFGFRSEVVDQSGNPTAS